MPPFWQLQARFSTQPCPRAARAGADLCYPASAQPVRDWLDSKNMLQGDGGLRGKVG